MFSGASKKRGATATSVETKVVTPSITLDGMNARTNQTTRSRADVASAVESVAWDDCAVWRGDILAGLQADRPSEVTSSAYPDAQSVLWLASVNVGSMTAGYASSATKLPALLAA